MLNNQDFNTAVKANTVRAVGSDKDDAMSCAGYGDTIICAGSSEEDSLSCARHEDTIICAGSDPFVTPHSGPAEIIPVAIQKIHKICKIPRRRRMIKINIRKALEKYNAAMAPNLEATPVPKCATPLAGDGRPPTVRRLFNTRRGSPYIPRGRSGEFTKEELFCPNSRRDFRLRCST